MAINFTPPTNRQKKRNGLSQREYLIGFCAVLALAVQFVFPAKSAGELFWLNFGLFFAFPSAVIYFFLKENLRDFGFSLGKAKMGLLLSLPAVAIFSLLIFFLISRFHLQAQFSFYFPMAENFWIFLWFELVIASVIFFSREFFFRGFLEFGLSRKLGYWAILLQAVLYTALFLRSSWTEILLIFFMSLAAGLIAFKSRSLFYSFLAVWLTSLIADIMLIRILTHNLK